MLPSIAEPMVLQLGPLAPARIGDVLVFQQGDVNVAHRIVAIEADGFRTAGDAQPHIVEAVPFERALGRVLAIWSDDSVTARRVDDRLHRLRGWYYARFHAGRRALRNAREKARDLIERARPQRRARLAVRLVASITAVQRADAAALLEALRCEAEALARIDERHRCAPMLGEAARRLGLTERLPPDVAAQLRRARLDAVLATGRMQRAIHRTVEVLRASRIEFVLLKGAARVYGAAPGAAYHPSDDIDVLVHARDVDRAVAALRAQGWAFRDADREVGHFRARHHHAASLFSPEGDYPVEIHHELAPLGSLSVDTTWDALRAHFVPLAGSAGTVLQLDPFGTALHLAIHAIELRRLRDIALLACALPALTVDQLEMLAETVRAERRDPVRLAAAVALAARIADVPWIERAGVDAYIRWALRREDLPKRLRQRSDAAEAYFARPNAPWSAMHKLVPWWSRGDQLIALPGRVLGRCASNALALLYATQMEPRKTSRSS
ncbi:MAG TPA: nucleotidyltransferase family protein [Candidatus Aquilonibacter sp.]